MFTCIFAGDHNHQFRYLAADHPFVELRHDFLDVRFNLVVRGGEHREAIFLDGGEIFGGVDASLKSGVA